MSPSEHASGLVGSAATPETGEEGEEGEENDGDDDEGEVGRVRRVRLRQAWLNVLPWKWENVMKGQIKVKSDQPAVTNESVFSVNQDVDGPAQEEGKTQLKKKDLKI